MKYSKLISPLKNYNSHIRLVLDEYNKIVFIHNNMYGQAVAKAIFNGWPYTLKDNILSITGGPVAAVQYSVVLKPHAGASQQAF